MGLRRWRPWAGHLGQRSLFLTLVPLLLAAGATGVLLFVVSLTRQADDEVQRGLRALGQIHAMHAALAEAASGVRGFIITKDDTFLRPYQRAEHKLSAALEELDRDIRDPLQREQLEAISRLMAVKLGNLSTLTARSRELSDGEMLTYSRDNKALLDQLRQRIASMEAREHQIIGQLQDRQQRTRQLGHLAMLAAVLAAFVLASVLSQGFALGLVRRIRHLRDNARRIGRREPLQVFPHQARDELAELDALLVQTSETLDLKLEELEAARGRAERASQAKSQFLSRTSHELRTPLTAILGFASLLHRHIEQPGQRRQLDAIQRSAEHLLQLVNDLLDLSRIEAGQITITPQPVDVAQAIARALEIVAGRAAARHSRVFREGGEGLPVVWADEGRVLQVLINLLDNALKFSPEGSSVLIRAQSGEGGGVRIDVVDEGPGIAEHFRAQLFNPFSRQDGQQEGAGLGLAISRGLMQAMGGTLEFQPASHGGSCFTLELPGAAAQAESGNATARGTGVELSGPGPVAIVAPSPAPAQVPVVVLHTEDDAFALRIEATVQRLGLVCHRVGAGATLPGAPTDAGWLLVHDARLGALPTCALPPVGVLIRGHAPLEQFSPRTCRTLPDDAPASTWRTALQEMLDELATPRHT